MSRPNDDTIATSNKRGDEKNMISNMEKYENYKTQFQRLNKAIANKFYLEAIFIEYAIMEDRTLAILTYEDKNNWERYARKSLKQKLDLIKSHANQYMPTTPWIGRYFSDANSNNLIDRIIDWKRERDRVTHSLMPMRTTTEELRNCAELGRDLCKELNNKTNNYKRMVERHTSNEQEQD